ncbi:CotH kinase family protein, partial [Vallitalea okinawensis]|uniref:CotH kinase family protein n=1 Tax=Vallitalea okinawensis TaxID=2078660 RepID=UPI0013005615
MSNKKKMYKILITLSLIVMIVFVSMTFVVIKENYKLVKYREDYNPISIESLREGYHDVFKHAYNSLTISNNPSNNSDLNSYYLNVDPNEFKSLSNDLPQSGEEYIDAYMKYEDEMHKVKLRFRGDNTWHWLYDKKSFRVKTKKDDLVEGVRKFNFVNPREKSMLVDYLEAELAKNMGILTAEVQPIRLFINNKYVGIYLSIDQTDESFLRNNKRLPSNLYVGEVPGIWNEAHKWEKFAEYNVMEENDFGDLEILIEKVNQTKDEIFPYEIEKILDLDKYINWYGHMEISGSLHVDSNHNNKLYFDPSSGKFEPIAWDTFGFSAHPVPMTQLNIPLNLLNYKILKNPKYVDEINQVIWRYTNNNKLSEYLLAEIENIYDMIKDDVYADRYKDYVDFSSDGSNNSRIYTNNEFDESVSILNEWIKLKEEYLINELNKNNAYVSKEIYNNKKNEGLITIAADGNSGTKIEDISFDSTYNEGSIQIWRDININGILDKEDQLINENNIIDKEVIINLDEVILPGRKEVKDDRYSANMSCVLEPSPLEYQFIVKYIGEEEGQ